MKKEAKKITGTFKTNTMVPWTPHPDSRDRSLPMTQLEIPMFENIEPSPTPSSHQTDEMPRGVWIVDI